MRRLILVVIAFMMLAATFIQAQPTNAASGSITYADSFCNDIFVVWGGGLYTNLGDTYSLVVTNEISNDVIYEDNNAFPPGSPFYIYLASFSPGAVEGDPLTLTFAATGIPTQTIHMTCVNGPAWPNDRRVAPQPWDRVAVYCNPSANPPTVEVWGIDTHSRGFPLVTFKFSDIVKAGPKGLFVKTKKYGVVSIMVDNQNNFWLAWNGNVTAPRGYTFYANGQPKEGFAKGFKCDFAR